MEEKQQTRPLKLDWDALVPDDVPPVVLHPKPSAMLSNQEPPLYVDRVNLLEDSELEESIQRKKRLLETTTGRNLPDGGARLRTTIKLYEDELSRRKVNPRPQKVDVEQKEPLQTTNSETVGTSMSTWMHSMERRLDRITKDLKKVLIGLDMIQQEQRMEAEKSWLRYNWLVQQIDPNLHLPPFEPPSHSHDVPKPASSDSSGDSLPPRK